MTVVYGDSFSAGVAIALWLLGSGMATVDVSVMVNELDSESVGAEVLKALHRADLPVKSAAAIMGMDESNLRKGLRGEKGHHLSLNRLENLPFSFWVNFFPALAHRIARKHLVEIADELRDFYMKRPA